MNPKFIYVFDALCSWCYAFHTELKKTLTTYDNYDLEVINGGMFIGNNDLRASDIAAPDGLRTMYQSVIDYGGAEITDKYIESLLIAQNPIISSRQPAQGICVFKDLNSNPRTQLEFVHDLQKQMYVDGVNPNSNEYFTNVLPLYDLDQEPFLEKLYSEHYQQKADEDFHYAKQLQVNSYPQLFIQYSDYDYFLLAKGYTKTDDINKRVESTHAEFLAQQN